MGLEIEVEYFLDSLRILKLPPQFAPVVEETGCKGLNHLAEEFLRLLLAILVGEV